MRPPETTIPPFKLMQRRALLAKPGVDTVDTHALIPIYVTLVACLEKILIYMIPREIHECVIRKVTQCDYIDRYLSVCITVCV